MKKVSLLVILAAMMLVAFVGCAQSTPAEESPAATEAPAVTEAPSEEPTTEASEEVSAEPVVLKVAGSTSVGPVIEALAEKYTAANPHVTIDVEQIGSGAGVTSAGDGTANLGMASRDLKEEEMTTYPDMQAHVLCLDGVAVVVNADNPVTDLTAEQVKQIFLGEITDWSEVGGEAGTITLYTRDSSSGTREAFQDLFDVEIEETKCIIVASNGEMGTNVENDPMGIGYMSLGIAPSYKVTSLNIDGVEATVENLISGDYAYFRNFNLLTMGDPEGELATFMDYCMNDAEAISYMEEKGYVMP